MSRERMELVTREIRDNDRNKKSLTEMVNIRINGVYFNIALQAYSPSRTVHGIVGIFMSPIRNGKS